ncbi:MAG: PAS domain S-box protein [Elusimicrobiota bacterium]
MNKIDKSNRAAADDILNYSKNIIAALREPILVLDQNLNVVSANQTFYNNFKLSPKETIGYPINKTGKKQWDIPELLILLKEILPEKKIIKDYKVEHKFEQIGKRVLLLNAYQLNFPVKKVVKNEKLILLAMEDITERRRAEEALKNSEERFRRAFETSNDGLLLVHKTKGDILEANKAAWNMLDCSEEEILKKKIWEVGVTENHSDFQAMMQELEKNGIFNYSSTTVKTEDGPKVNADVFLVDRAKVVQCNIRNISARKQAEKQIDEILKRSQEIANLGSWELDVKSGRLIWSDQTFRIFGFKPQEFQPTYKKFLDAVHPEDRKILDKVYTSSVEKNKDSYEIEHRIITNDTNEIRYVYEKCQHIKDSSNNIVRSIGMVHDITDRRKAYKEKEKLQQQLLQSQKMEAIGNLTGGVAHDFNNIITSIKITAQLLLEEDLPDVVKNDLNEINKSSDRAKNLTRQLLQFSRRDTVPKNIINLNTVIKNTFEMLERTIPENINITSDLQSDLRAINAAPSTMQQIIMNLAINARDAMPNGGKLTIKTENIEITSNNLPTSEIEPGKYVKLTVWDNGTGMDEQTKSQIYEPFFTTKGIGKGTGLGLSVVFGVVKSCEGDIKVESNPGKGTGIKILLPAVKSKEKKIGEEKVKDKVSKESTGRGMGILVLEDEEKVRKAVCKVLEKTDFKIFTAATAEDAETIFKEKKENIDVIFADVILPDGNGIEIADKFKRIKEDLRVIITSGYIADKETRENIAQKNLKFVEKPFSLKKIREILTELTEEIKNK